jgi:hypothetical protein
MYVTVIFNLYTYICICFSQYKVLMILLFSKYFKHNEETCCAFVVTGVCHFKFKYTPWLLIQTEHVTVYFTSRGRGLKIHEKSLTNKSISKSKPSDDWHHMSDTDCESHCMYKTSYSIKNQYICVNCLMSIYNSIIRYYKSTRKYNVFKLKVTALWNVMLWTTVDR